MEHLEFLMQFFKPATKETSTEKLTSRQIQVMVNEHNGTNIELKDICQFLRQKGFLEDYADGQLVWLVGAVL